MEVENLERMSSFDNPEPSGKDIDEQIQLLMQDTDEPNLDHGKPLEDLPEWFDKEKFLRGQKFFRSNYYSLFVSKLCGLLVILSTPRVLRILTMTQKSSNPRDAFKRYLDTLSHMLMWYNGDVTKRDSWAFKSLKMVHMKHSAANKTGIAKKVGTLSQSSLAITQFGFMGFGLLMPEKLGIKITDEKDVEGFIHFWRVVGFLLGVDEKHNICNGSVEETKTTCKRVLEEILWPYLKEPSKDFIENAKTVLLGMWAMVPFINVEGFMAFTYDLAGLEIEPFTNWWSQSIYNFQKFVHKNLNNSYFGQLLRMIFNFQMWLSVVISERFPLFAYLSFGMPTSSNMEVL